MSGLSKRDINSSPLWRGFVAGWWTPAAWLDRVTGGGRLGWWKFGLMICLFSVYFGTATALLLGWWCVAPDVVGGFAFGWWASERWLP